jgi:RNA polymerase sigma factor (sigma-70 family)
MSETNQDLTEVVGALVASHGRKWLKFAARIVGSHEDAEDVLQEAVHRVLECRRPFTGTADVRMYLARAITNQAFELYRVRKRERTRRVPLQDESVPAFEGTSPMGRLEERERALERAQVARIVREGLARLPPKQYEALHLTLLAPGHVSIRAAVVERGIPYSTLRHRSLQGIRRLQRFVRRALRSFPAKLVLA